MKVGEYVRFKTLCREIKIGKVIEIIAPDKNSMKKYCVYDLDNNEATVDDYVIKSSQNIIDLIEVGDYVNGYKVYEENGYLWIKRVSDDKYKVPHYTRIDFEEFKIKSIVTKEQFESMEYKAGE